MPSSFRPSPNVTSGDTQASGSYHQMTGSVTITGSLTVNGVAITGGGGGGGSGDVSGPGSATDNAVARFNGTGGKTIQNSSVTIDDSNNVTGIAALTSTGNLSLGNSLSDYHQVTGTLSISGSTVELLGSHLKVSSSTQYQVGSDTFYTLLSFYDQGKEKYVSGTVWNLDQERLELRNFGDDNGYKAFAADAIYSAADYQFIGGNMTIGDGNISTGGSLTVQGQNPVFAAEGNTVLKLQAGFKAGEETGILRIQDQDETIYSEHSHTGSHFFKGITSSLGFEPQGTAADSIQIGNNNGAVAIGSLNISFGGTVSGQGSQAIGAGSPRAIGAGASAIGSGSVASAANAIGLGTQAYVNGVSSVAIGNAATGSAANVISLGNSSVASSAGSTAIGNQATSSAPGAIAIGSSATTAGSYSVVMGDNITHVTNDYVTVIGPSAGAGGTAAISIGSGSSANAEDTIALGQSATAGGANAIAIGESAAPSAADAISIGKSAAGSATGSVVIGAGATNSGQQAVALGAVNNAAANYTTIVGYNNHASVNYSIIIGDTSYAHGANALAIGQNVYATGADSIALGQNATASADNSMAFGSGSNASEANTIVYGNSTQPVRMFVSGAMAQTYFSASVNVHTAATCSFYNIFNYHLGGTLTLTAQDQIAGASYLFFLRQDGSGNRAVTFSGFKWPGGSAPTLSTAANAVDVVSGISDGTSIYADITKNFS